MQIRKGKIKIIKIDKHIYLKVKPKRISLSLGMCSKLVPKFYGPFEILAKIGPVAYELALPTHIRVHKSPYESIMFIILNM